MSEFWVSTITIIININNNITITIPLKLNSTGHIFYKAEALGRIARLHYADNNLSEACNVTEQSLEVLKGCDLSSRPLMVQMLLLMLEVGSWGNFEETGL